MKRTVKYRDMLCIYMWADQFHSRVVSQFGRLAQNRISVAKEIALANTHIHTQHTAHVLPCVWVPCHAYGMALFALPPPSSSSVPTLLGHTHTHIRPAATAATAPPHAQQSETKRQPNKRRAKKKPQAMLFRAQFPQLIPVLFILMTVPT